MPIHVGFLLASLSLLGLLMQENARRSLRSGRSWRSSLTRPSQVVLLYTAVFHVLGSMFFVTGQVLDPALLADAEQWGWGTLWIYLALGLVATLATNRLGCCEPAREGASDEQTKVAAWVGWPLAGLGLVAANVALGSALALLAATSCFLVGVGGRSVRRVVLFGPLLGSAVLLLPVLSNSKRLLIFPVLAAVLVLWARDRLTSRTLAVALGLLVALLLPLSILRGYGNFDVDHFGDAVQVAPSYVRSDSFVASFGNNTEAVSFYFHGMNALDVFLWSENLVLGETVVNAIFTGSSVYGLDDRFRSSIDIYTSVYDPAFRERGGSYPIALVAEAVMNFGPVGLLAYPLLLLLLDHLARWFAAALAASGTFAAEAAFVYCTMLLARGSSFDLLVFNLLGLGAPLVLLQLVRLPRKADPPRAEQLQPPPPQGLISAERRRPSQAYGG